VLLVLAVLAASVPPFQSSLDVRLVTDEADAALSILQLRRAGKTPGAEDWQRVYSSAGYRALAQRESSFGRPFSEDRFKAFLLSDTLLARTEALAATLASWKNIDAGDAARLALAYLPAGTVIRSTLFFEIKPQTNSFVFDLDGQRAIFLYVDPARSGPEIRNTMAHELHHVGISIACRDSGGAVEDSAVWRAKEWMSAFGEGLAMLAAAGGPDVHPHVLSDSATRARWDHDVANFNPDLRRLQAFFFDVLDRRAPVDSLRARGMSFFGVQGPWYTVGWRMAVTVEKAFGRQRLVADMCSPARFLATYNNAVQRLNDTTLATWSDSLLRRVGA
jgi:hypothetical protein